MLAENRAKTAKGLETSTLVCGPVRAGSRRLAGPIKTISLFEKTGNTVREWSSRTLKEKLIKRYWKKRGTQKSVFVQLFNKAALEMKILDSST